MAKQKQRTYLLVHHPIQDEGAVMVRLTKQKILDLVQHMDSDDYAVVDGDVIKNFEQKSDLKSRLK